jgi:hypothetical protein
MILKLCFKVPLCQWVIGHGPKDQRTKEQGARAIGVSVIGSLLSGSGESRGAFYTKTVRIPSILTIVESFLSAQTKLSISQ